MPPPLEKHDMTLDELKQYDGKGTDGRVCIAIMGKIFDCTRGRKFYGPVVPTARLPAGTRPEPWPRLMCTPSPISTMTTRT